MFRPLIHSWERKLSRRDTNRVTYPFEWGLEFLDGNKPLNGNDTNGSNGNHVDAREVVFQFNERVIANSHSFFSPAAVPAYSFDGNWLSFDSPLVSPYEENNVVYARYFPVPPRKDSPGAGLAAGVGRARGRAVLVLPQWNGDIQAHVGVCRLLNQFGIAALRLSMPYHDRRQVGEIKRADFMVSANVGRTLQAARQAVLDSRAAIDWLVAQGYDRIGIMGTSIGSCISFLTFIHDERIRVGVYNHVSSYFGDVVWEGISTAHVRRALETALTREEVRRAWLAISPNSYINRLSQERRRALFISARYDLSFTPELSRLLFDECDRHEVGFDRTLVPWGHYTMGKFPFKYYLGYLFINYFRKHL